MIHRGDSGDFEGYLKAQIETSSGSFAYYDNLSGTTSGITPGSG